MGILDQLRQNLKELEQDRQKEEVKAQVEENPEGAQVEESSVEEPRMEMKELGLEDLAKHARDFMRNFASMLREEKVKIDGLED